MENNQKELKMSSLYNKVILTGLITLILLGVFGLYIYPQFAQVGENKNILRDKISTYEGIQKNGLTYNEFKDLVGDEKIKESLSQAGEEFFNTNLKNEKSKDYLSFIEEKKEYVDKINKSNLIKVRDEKLSKVLPSYTQGYFVEGNMTDLDFVNYVELLLRTFGLKTDSKIGMEDLVLENNTLDDKSEENKLSSQIFYIPLSLSLEGKKSDIIEFIYFLQKVGVPASVTQENITFNNNNVINRTISGQKRTFNYNIYENRIIDISSINLSSYIDNSTSSRSPNQMSTEGFLSFIKNGTEKDDVYKVDVKLKFYVKGLPTYKIESYIQNVISKYDELFTKSKILLSKAQNRNKLLLNGEMVDILATLKTVNTYLNDIDTDIKLLRTGLSKKTDLNNLYKKASLINYDLLNLEQYVEKLNIDKNLK